LVIEKRLKPFQALFLSFADSFPRTKYLVVVVKTLSSWHCPVGLADNRKRPGNAGVIADLGPQSAQFRTVDWVVGRNIEAGRSLDETVTLKF
jgi:hypothetical protein